MGDRARGRGSISSPDTERVSSKRRRSESANSNNPAKRDEPPKPRRSFRMDILKTIPEHVLRRGNKCGDSGTSVVLQANYFQLQTQAHWKLFAYHVSFDPDIELRSIKTRLLKDFGTNVIPTKHFFDGSIMRTSEKLTEDLNVFEANNREGMQFKVTLKFVKEETSLDPTFHQHLNLILRLAMKQLRLQQVGRNLYDAASSKKINQLRIELWPGYSTSIRLHDGGLLMNVDAITKVMRQETLHSILQTCLNQREYRAAYAKEVIGTVVLTDYNNQTYQVLDIAWDKSPSSTFETKEGEETYESYYRKKYQITIQDPKQPLLIAKPKEKKRRDPNAPDFIALIPELCRATGLSEEQRSDNRLMRSVADATRLDARSRAQRLLQFNERLRTTPESVKVFREWQMNLNPNLVKINARVMEPELIVFQSDRVRSVNADWTQAMRNQKFHSTGSLPRGRWVVLTPRKHSSETQNFVQTLRKAVAPYGFQIDTPEFCEISNDSTSVLTEELNRAIRNEPAMIMVILSCGNTEKYAAVKKKTCVDHHIPTQVILAKTFRNKGLLSVATKVGIQMNSKLGFNSWYIRLPLTELMICGYDVTHDTRNKKMSYGALVASIHKAKDTCSYFSTAMPHESGNEMSDTLWMMMMGAIRYYQTIHGTLPNKIIFYRDGVGEGQLQLIYENELQNLVQKLNQTYAAYNKKLAERDAPPIQLRFAFIIVNKRVNSRFFQDRDQGNPTCGTVIDKTVTLPERYDFFLVSQHVRQGTVSPTAYNVVYDTVELPPEKLQMLTFKACHLYYNWSGTVRVPAVVQYAKKLAFLCGQYLHKAPNPKIMGEKLYFL